MGRARDVSIGVAKSAADTAIGLGELVHRIPGVSRAVESVYDFFGVPGVNAQQSFPAARALVQPANEAQQTGFYGGQLAQFALPTGGVTRAVKVASQVGTAGALTAAQGGGVKESAVAAGASTLIPGAGAVRRGAKVIADQAEPLVRAAIKPTVASLKRITGAGNMDAKANALVRFIIDNGLTTADKARDLFLKTEHELQRILAVKNAPTDAATRAARYLEALERSAAKQGLGADDVATINKAAAELLEGPLGKDVITMVPTPHPTLVGANGNPITVLRPHVTRELRPDVPANEALGSARASSRWKTRKSWGEQKGATTEAVKAVERAERDAVKVAVPEARALLQTEGKALQAEDVLGRMAQRAGNRDVASLPAQVIAAGEIARGGVPILAFASNWLRNNQLKAGMWADSLGKAIQAGNAPMVADILKKLGVGASSQAMRSAPATP